MSYSYFSFKCYSTLIYGFDPSLAGFDRSMTVGRLPMTVGRLHCPWHIGPSLGLWYFGTDSSYYYFASYKRASD